MVWPKELTQSMESAHASVQREVASSNPVLRTFLYSEDVRSSQRYLTCVLCICGIALVAIGPIAGLLTKHSIERSVLQRQKITNFTNCFVQRVDLASQLCQPHLELKMHFFHIDNADDVRVHGSRPILSERGPYYFRAVERHANVYYELPNEVHFQRQALELERDETQCDGSCSWNATIHVFANNSIQIGTVETLLPGLWPLREANVVLDTGEMDISNVYDTLMYNAVSHVGGKFNGRVFGKNLKRLENVKIFDEWLATEVQLQKHAEKVERGVQSILFNLAPTETCIQTGESCENVTWNISSTQATSLPYLFYDNETTANSENTFDSVEHGWSVVIDDEYGFTIQQQTTYQQNNWIEAYGDTDFWAQSFWLQQTFTAQDEDISFIKRQLLRKHLAFYLCEIALPLGGSVLMLIVFGLLFCTPSARKRLATIALLSRSRARDPRLNPKQFRSLGAFSKNQFRSKRKTHSTNTTSSVGKPAKATSNEVKTEFDDVRHMPNTQTI